MTDDFYQAALAALRHHLETAGVAYSLDDGELLVNGHRLGLAITFEGFVRQGAHMLAPLDIQVHVDGDSGDKFRVGTLGVGSDQAGALQAAIAEWHLLAASPLLSALGAAVENRRAGSSPQLLAGWGLFAGRAGIRGSVPPALQSGGQFVRSLVEQLRQFVARWDQPDRFELRSIFVMATCGPEGREIQAAVDGMLDADLIAALSALSWPQSGETYLYKQLFVLRNLPRD